MVGFLPTLRTSTFRRQKNEMKTLINNAVLFTTLLILLGCVPGTGSNIQTLQTRHNSTSTLEYFNSATFDESLSNAMKQENGKIEVSVSTPFSPNNVPKRLDTWFTVIKEKGGKTEVKPIDGERMVTKEIVNLILFLYSVYQSVKTQLRYLPAENYNATLLYQRDESGEALIEKIVFTHK